MKFLNNCSLLQVFNILADYHGKAVCIFNIVMSCRKFEMYKRVLLKIKERFPIFQPQQLMADYETAMRRGFKTSFPDARILGCR